MPLGRYLTFTTSLLLALLFLADRYMLKPPVESTRAEVDRSIMRIHSGQKWPDAVVIDTSLATVAAPQTLAADVPAKTLPREAFAQLPQTVPVARSTSSTTEPKPVALRHPIKATRSAVKRMVSYQPTEFRGEPRPGW